MPPVSRSSIIVTKPLPQLSRMASDEAKTGVANPSVRNSVAPGVGAFRVAAAQALTSSWYAATFGAPSARAAEKDWGEGLNSVLKAITEVAYWPNVPAPPPPLP